MKKMELVKLVMIVTIIAFFCLYFTTMGGYYEYNTMHKNILTEDAIKRFEEDVAAGKQIIASNYIEQPKNYNNKTSQLTLKLSNIISKTFDKIMKYIFKQIETTVNG